MEPLKREFDYYLTHQKELVEKYNGKFIVIKGDAIIGAYKSAFEAVKGAEEKGHELGTFLVQKCEPGNASLSQTYHSRVIFT